MVDPHGYPEKIVFREKKIPNFRPISRKNSRNLTKNHTLSSAKYSFFNMNHRCMSHSALGLIRENILENGKPHRTVFEDNQVSVFLKFSNRT